MPKFLRIQPPPQLFLREFEEGEIGIEPTDIVEYLRLEQYRWGLLDTWHNELYLGIAGDAEPECCPCFRWVWTTRATTDGQTVFFPPLHYMTLEDSPYQIVFSRTNHLYYGTALAPQDYEVSVANNSITLVAGIPEGELLTIYALRHNDIQEVYYETCAIPATPYLYSPPVTVDRAAGRQLLFARTAPRFLDSGRPGDEYTVSNTVNTISLTAGLGPVDALACIYRLMEGGVLWHEEILATAAGQAIFTPGNLEMYVKPHDVGKMMIFQRTSFLHPAADYITDVAANTITINAPGLAVDQPLNVWTFR